MNTLFKVYIFASCLTLLSAYNEKELRRMLMWSWDNCRDQLNAYSNLMSTFLYDLQLFRCASASYQSQYEKTLCEDQAKINTKHDIVKNFYFVCVDNYEKFKKEKKNSCNSNCFIQNFCKYSNKEKSEAEEEQQQYIDYLYQKDITDCDVHNCEENTQIEIEYKICSNSQIMCCEVEMHNSRFFDFYDQSIVYLYSYYLLKYLYLIMLSIVFISIVAFYRIHIQ